MIADKRLKERLVGAVVLVLLAVVFLPLVLDDEDSGRTRITESNIPPRPDTEFSSSLVPVPDSGRSATPDATTSAPTSPATSPATSPTRKAAKTDKVTGAWVVQIGSFADRKNASKLDEALRDKGYKSYVQEVEDGAEDVYKVRVGPELLRSDAKRLQEKLQQTMSLKGIVISYP
ncbi:MAG: SPOR domain-containing protein [Gammaproteobacteria bacterium]